MNRNIDSIIKTINNTLLNSFNNIRYSGIKNGTIYLEDIENRTFNFLILNESNTNKLSLKEHKYLDNINRRIEQNAEQGIYTGIIQINPKRITIRDKKRSLAYDEDLRKLLRINANLKEPTRIDELIINNYIENERKKLVRLNEFSYYNKLIYTRIEFLQENKTRDIKIGNLREEQYSLRTDFIKLNKFEVTNPSIIFFDENNFKQLIFFRPSTEEEKKDLITKIKEEKKKINPKKYIQTTETKKNIPNKPSQETITDKTKLGYETIRLTKEIATDNANGYNLRHKDKIIRIEKENIPLYRTTAYGAVIKQYLEELEQIQMNKKTIISINMEKRFFFPKHEGWFKEITGQEIPDIYKFAEEKKYEIPDLNNPELFNKKIKQINEEYLRHIQKEIEPVVHNIILSSKMVQKGLAKKVKKNYIYQNNKTVIKTGFIQTKDYLRK